MQNYLYKYSILLSLILTFYSSSIFAEEEVYPYVFQRDTTLTGRIVAEGNIFDKTGLDFISIHNTFTNENLPPSLFFYDQNFNIVEKLDLTSPQSAIIQNILVFDIDRDSLDEVIFIIRNPDKLSFVYFDPSNQPVVKKVFFEIPVKGHFLNLTANVVPAQLDDDSFFEVVITSSEQTIRAYTKPGIWLVDIESGKTFWKKLLAASPQKTTPIIFDNSGNHNIIYSSSSRKITKFDFYYSNGFYHYIDNNSKKETIYDENFIEKNVLVDSTSEDFETSTKSYIASVDLLGKLNWKINIDFYPQDLNLCYLKNKNQLLFSTSRFNNTSIKILDITTGQIENQIELQKKFRLYLLEDKIFLSSSKNIFTLNLDLEKTDSLQTKLTNTLIETFNLNNNKLVLMVEANGTIIQKLNLIDENLDKVANLEIRGKTNYFPKAKLVSVYNSATRSTRLFSIVEQKWYNLITPETLRTLVISFLIILTFFMVLWISTLRVSSKKIKRQKDALEKSNFELKETTNKLIEVEKLAVYGTIAGSIAHEINSPLGAIINSAQRIKNDKNADIEKNINLIEKAGKRSKNIIQKLLIGTPGTADESTSNLNEVVEEWKELSGKQFENLGITLKTKIKCNSKLAISPTELSQIITNLLFNARDSLMENSNSKKEVVIESRKLDNNCLISILDTGTGFSSSKLENPFEAFKTSKKRGQGTGLGLWVIKRIIDKVGGEINIQNYDLGAKVEIIIPLLLEKQNG